MSERYTIHLGDCLAVLRTLPDASVDAVITDPPYGIGFKYDHHDDTPEGYGAWLWSVLEMAEAKAKPLAPVFVFQAMLNVRRFHEWFPRDWRLYAAAKNFVQMRQTAMQYAYDPVVVWWKPGEGKPYSAGTASRDFFVANTSGIISNRDRPEKAHPCPRPLDQMRVLVEQWVPKGGVVLDPFAGSGTTGVACAGAGCDFIGIEVSPAYHAIAQARVAAAYGQQRMF